MLVYACANFGFVHLLSCTACAISTAKSILRLSFGLFVGTDYVSDYEVFKSTQNTIFRDT